MTRTKLLDDLKSFTVAALKDLILPCAAQKGEESPPRAFEVYQMRLPDSTDAKRKAPYIIHQVVTGKDATKNSSTAIRSVFCIYYADEQKGALMLLEAMDRLRIALLQTVVIGEQFVLDEEAGVEMMVYAEDTTPYYIGEMSTSWKMPMIRREVKYT